MRCPSAFLLVTALLSPALSADPAPAPAPVRPTAQVKQSKPAAQLEPEAIVGLDKIAPARRQLVERALRIGRENTLGQYLFGSADPKNGGFDCSGAMFYLLTKHGLTPPRSSSQQFEWVKDAGLLTEVPAEVSSLEHEVFTKLKPGDLLFWAGTYKPTDGRTNGVTHVQMYLGEESEDRRMIMIGSSDGRSYRRQRQCGYGVYDLSLPRAGSKARFVGFGPPPGLLPKSAK